MRRVRQYAYPVSIVCALIALVNALVAFTMGFEKSLAFGIIAGASGLGMVVSAFIVLGTPQERKSGVTKTPQTLR